MEHLGFRVMVRACDQCLFGSRKIVDEQRKAEVLAISAETFFVCHKATIGHLRGGCCRAYFDRADTGTVKTVKDMGLPIQWIDPDTLEDVTQR